MKTNAYLKVEPLEYLKNISGREILQLKNNCIPKGLVPLEKLFDNNDVAHQPKMTPNADEVEDCNIRTEENPKIIKNSKNVSTEAKDKYIHILNLFADVFA